MLLIACRALATDGTRRAHRQRPADIEKIEHLLEEIASGGVRSVAFAIPWGGVWSLPAYNGINHLPVVEGERPLGLVGMRDVVRTGAPFGTGIELGF